MTDPEDNIPHHLIRRATLPERIAAIAREIDDISRNDRHPPGLRVDLVPGSGRRIPGTFRVMGVVR